MLSRKGTFVFCLLLHLATAGFAQSATGQRISLKTGATIKLMANAIGAKSYQWLRNGTTLVGATNQVYTVGQPGKYAVVYSTMGGCSSDPSEEIEVVFIGISADVSIVKRSEIRQVSNNEVFKYYLMVRNNGASDATNVQVRDVLPDNLVFESIEQPADGMANFSLTSKTISWVIPSLINGRFLELTINVRATKAGQVTNSATVTINEQDPDPLNNTSTETREILGLKIPNVFTPNGDGKNDTFFIEKLDTYTARELTIINRWGSTVFERDNYLNDWSAEGLVEGTYFYVLKVRTATDGWQEFKGYVTVIR